MVNFTRPVSSSCRSGPVLAMLEGASGKVLTYVDVIDLDAFFAAVLHPQQLSLGGVETGMLQRFLPRFAVDGNGDCVTLKG